MKLFFGFILSFVVNAWAEPVVTFKTQGLTLEFNSNLGSRILEMGGEFSESEKIFLDNNKHSELFAYVSHENTKRGVVIQGKSSSLEKTITIETDKEFPGAATFKVEYKNTSQDNLKISSWVNNSYKFKPKGDLWAYLPVSLEKRPDWLRKLKPGFKEKNFLGMTSTDFGGGTPFLGVWSKEIGVAIGSLEKEPSILSLPVSYDKTKSLTMALEQETHVVLAPKKTFETKRTFLTTFHGDVFNPLRSYAKFMADQGLEMPETPKSIGPIWCAWGYGRDFTVDQIIKTLPEAKRLGFEWVGIDDGWQTAIGDWTVNTKKFPGGEADLKKLVDEIHKLGMKAQLWWAPLAAHQKSNYVASFKNRLLLNENQTPREITWWDSSYLCPAEENVIDDMASLTKKFIKDWGFDGLKIDGQHLNASPQCYNQSHKHENNTDSYVHHHELFKKIYKVAASAKKDVLVETCPCGTSYSIYNLPYQNLTVAADPESSTQVRQKGKVLKAITGDKMVFFGDHVELSEQGMDFASTMAIGGLVGSNFTLPELNQAPPVEGEPNTKLNQTRKKHWEKWIAIANEKKLWLGEYQGDVYDVGFDFPEGHVVIKDGITYYAFFADNFKGTIWLKGLKKGNAYSITDYANGKDLGVVSIIGTEADTRAELKTSFKKFLLLEAKPVSKITGI